MKLSVFWFRRDLRLEDNVGLSKALESGFPVLPVFIFDKNIIEELSSSDPRVNFIYDRLSLIDKKLKKHGSSLKVIYGDPIEEWKRLMEEHQIAAVYWNKDYEPYALERDANLRKALKEKLIASHSFKDQVIFEAGEVFKADGGPYTVYTPYKNKWLSLFDSSLVKALPKVEFKNFNPHTQKFPSLKDIGFKSSSIKVRDFNISELSEYSVSRDFPAPDNTSYLSPHLRFGTLSIRSIIRGLQESDAVFLSELIWREFFMQILYHFPHVVINNFRAKYDGIAWRNDEEEYLKWCEGKTGYPLVDAGMRQLNETGYMHNRVRMVTAGFLCKHLLIDWRWGEVYFAEKLLDYELSSNNGNWQWAAGTGCDAAPYFRIFNPTAQMQKFDSKMEYVKRWVPEFGGMDYPNPMVEHKFARQRALDAYKKGILES